MLLCTVAPQAPLSIGFSRLDYWGVLPCPLPGDLPNPGIEPGSLTSPVLESRFFTTNATWKTHAAVHGVTKSWTRLSQFYSTHSFTHKKTTARQQIDGHLKEQTSITQILTGSILSKIGIAHTNFIRVWKNSAYKISSYLTQCVRPLKSQSENESHSVAANSL